MPKIKWEMPEDYMPFEEFRKQEAKKEEIPKPQRILDFMTMEEQIEYDDKLRNYLINHYGEAKFPVYDNFEEPILECPFVANIPGDWEGLIGVPIGIVDYLPNMFIEIVGAIRSWDISPTKKYKEIYEVSKDGKKRKKSGLTSNALIKVKTPPKGKTYYICDGDYFVIPYMRIVIKCHYLDYLKQLESGEPIENILASFND